MGRDGERRGSDQENNGREGLLDLKSGGGKTVTDCEQGTDHSAVRSEGAGQRLSSGCHNQYRRRGA